MDYNKLTPETLSELSRIAGAENVLSGQSIGADMCHDERPLYGTAVPEAVVYVQDEEQVSELLRLCSAARLPVTVRGAGTGLAGGAVAAEGGVVLCTARMNRIISCDEEEMSVLVQPGVTLMELNEYLAARGLRYTPDPGEKTATIGGNAATNAGGPNAFKYGSTRDNVLSVRAVLPSGEAVQLGCDVRKCNDGYNLMQLLLGSEGTLAVITELKLKLRPAVKAQMGFILPFDSLESCLSAAGRLANSGLSPETLEFMDSDMIAFSSSVSGSAVFPAEMGGEHVGAVLYTNFAGESDEELEAVMEKVAELSEELMPLDVLVVDDPTLRRNVEEAHEALHMCVETRTKRFDESNAAVPPAKLAEYIGELRACAEELGLTLHLFGHAGDGNVHAYVYNDEVPDEEFMSRTEAFMERNYRKCIELGGAVSAEHGIGRGKKRYLGEKVGDGCLALMRSIKRAFDPEQILNPGKIF